jgi:hypothetical protein
MLERLRRLFRSGSAEPPGAAPASSRASSDPFGVPFQPDLPARMLEAHAAMRAAFELAQDSERRGEPERAMAHLKAFDLLMRSYVAGLSTDFHAHLGERFAGESGRLMPLRSIRAQLRLLSHEVHDLVQPRRAEGGRPAKPVQSRTLFEWGTTLRDKLDELERDLLPLYPRDRPLER